VGLKVGCYPNAEHRRSCDTTSRPTATPRPCALMHSDRFVGSSSLFERVMDGSLRHKYV